MAKLEDAYAKIAELEAVNLSAMANARAERAEEGVADLAMKHRDSAESECKTLRERLSGLFNAVVEHTSHDTSVQHWSHDDCQVCAELDKASAALNPSPADK